MEKIEKLVALLKNEKQVYIQTHNFPDHDAVASAYGLGELLRHFGIRTKLIYDGTIQRDSLADLIARYSIDIRNESAYGMTEDDPIVIVDGCKGNKNVTDLIGREVAVIDHHQVSSPDDVVFSDIRPEYGACSTIIYRYYRDAGVSMSADVGTLLLAGILVDTAHMTRGVSEADLEAYSSLYVNSDVMFVNSHLRNHIRQKELAFYRHAIDRLKVHGTTAFCYFDEGCNQNLMGLLGDFFLSVAEFDLIVLCAKNDNVINFSIRSERRDLNAGFIIQRLLAGIGFGGGHADMAGGIIKNADEFRPDAFYQTLIGVLADKSAVGP